MNVAFLNVPTPSRLRRAVAASIGSPSSSIIKLLANDFVANFVKHLNDLVADPQSFASHQSYEATLSSEVRRSIEAEEIFFKTLRAALPKGYSVELIHFGPNEMLVNVRISW